VEEESSRSGSCAHLRCFNDPISSKVLVIIQCILYSEVVHGIAIEETTRLQGSEYDAFSEGHADVLSQKSVITAPGRGVQSNKIPHRGGGFTSTGSMHILHRK